MKKIIWTIENGYIDDNGEEICTNETNYLTKEDYEKDLAEILKSTINNFGNAWTNGWYVECYQDIQEITQEDIENIKDYKSLIDCAGKSYLIQSYRILNKNCAKGNFYLDNDVDEINEWLKQSQKGVINEKDDTELCSLYDDIEKPEYSLYLAVYNGKLVWTLNKHKNNDCDDFGNVWTFEWNTKELDSNDLTADNLFIIATDIFWKLKNNYEEVKRGIKQCL